MCCWPFAQVELEDPPPPKPKEEEVEKREYVLVSDQLSLHPMVSQRFSFTALSLPSILTFIQLSIIDSRQQILSPSTYNNITTPIDHELLLQIRPSLQRRGEHTSPERGAKGTQPLACNCSCTSLRRSPSYFTVPRHSLMHPLTRSFRLFQVNTCTKLNLSRNLSFITQQHRFQNPSSITTGMEAPKPR